MRRGWRCSSLRWCRGIPTSAQAMARRCRWWCRRSRPGLPPPRSSISSRAHRRANSRRCWRSWPTLIAPTVISTQTASDWPGPTPRHWRPCRASAPAAVERPTAGAQGTHSAPPSRKPRRPRRHRCWAATRSSRVRRWWPAPPQLGGSLQRQWLAQAAIAQPQDPSGICQRPTAARRAISALVC